MSTTPALKHWDDLYAAWAEASQAATEARVMCAQAETGATAEQIACAENRELLADALRNELDQQVRKDLGCGPVVDFEFSAGAVLGQPDERGHAGGPHVRR